MIRSNSDKKTTVRYFILLFVLLIALITIPALAAQTGDSSFIFNSLTFDNLERTYYIYTPANYDDSTPAPLLIALHPGASNGNAMAILTGLNAIADEKGFIAVYPDAYEATWGEGQADEETPDDVGYINALIDHLTQTYAIDEDQVFLTGFGNGALMSYRLGCETPERFTSIAAVGNLMWELHKNACNAVTPEANAPVNMLIVHGTESAYYPLETHVYVSIFGEQHTILGREDTLDVWVDRNACNKASVEREANTIIYNDCSDDVTVALYSIEGASINWTRTGNYALNQLGVDTTGVITRFFFNDESWITAPAEIAETLARTYVYYVPSSYSPDEPMPVMITLHGRYGNGPGTAAYTKMNDVAEANGFIALYPDALKNVGSNYPYDWGWNFYRGSRFFMSAEHDDVAFMANLLDDLAQDLNIDQSRIYVNGLSNGGFMVQKLACEDPERYAAFASVAGSGYHDMPENCDHKIPVPMLIIHGTADNNVPWDGKSDVMPDGTIIYSAAPIPELTNFWVYHNDCEAEYVSEDLPQKGDSPETFVRVFTVEACPVVLYAISGGGHNWPGISPSTQEVGNLVNMDINASEVIWEFSSHYSR